MVYVAGAAVVRGEDPAEASLEELVFEAAAAALSDAGTTRAEIDGVCPATPGAASRNGQIVADGPRPV